MMWMVFPTHSIAYGSRAVKHAQTTVRGAAPDSQAGSRAGVGGAGFRDGNERHQGPAGEARAQLYTAVWLGRAPASLRT